MGGVEADCLVSVTWLPCTQLTKPYFVILDLCLFACTKVTTLLELDVVWWYGLYSVTMMLVAHHLIVNWVCIPLVLKSSLHTRFGFSFAEHDVQGKWKFVFSTMSAINFPGLVSSHLSLDSIHKELFCVLRPWRQSATMNLEPRHDRLLQYSSWGYTSYLKERQQTWDRQSVWVKTPWWLTIWWDQSSCCLGRILLLKIYPWKFSRDVMMIALYS